MYFQLKLPLKYPGVVVTPIEEFRHSSTFLRLDDTRLDESQSYILLFRFEWNGATYLMGSRIATH